MRSQAVHRMQRKPGVAMRPRLAQCECGMGRCLGGGFAGGHADHMHRGITGLQLVLALRGSLADRREAIAPFVHRRLGRWSPYAQEDVRRLLRFVGALPPVELVASVLRARVQVVCGRAVQPSVAALDIVRRIRQRPRQVYTTRLASLSPDGWRTARFTLHLYRSPARACACLGAARMRRFRGVARSCAHRRSLACVRCLKA